MQKRLPLFVCFLLYLSAGYSQAQPGFSGKGNSFVFIENKGQIRDQAGRARSDILYAAKNGNVTLFVGRNSLHYSFSAKIDDDSSGNFTYAVHRIDMTLEGAAVDATAEVNVTPYYENYFNIPEIPKGVSGARGCDRIVFKEVYPGIDWVLYSVSGMFKYDFVVHPGADPRMIRMKYTGSNNIYLEETGELKIISSLGTLTEQKPFTYNSQSGVEVPSAFKLSGNEISFSVDDRIVIGETMVIDPGVVWCTFFGGSEHDISTDVADLGDKRVVICGNTQSVSGIATLGAHEDTLQGSNDIMLAMFNDTGKCLWATYAGGVNSDLAQRLSLDTKKNILITGSTASVSGIAGNGGHNQTAPGTAVPFVMKFTDSGIFRWGTYYYGTSSGAATYGDIATDKNDNVYLLGHTNYTSGIAAGGYQNTKIGTASTTDFFLVKFLATGPRLWATYYGGSGTEVATSMFVDDSAGVYIAGNTSSGSGLATSGTHQTAINGGVDGILAKFDSTGKRLVVSTYYGGGGTDDVTDIVVIKGVGVVISGTTYSSNQISHNGFYNSQQAGFNSYIAQLDVNLKRKWGTYYHSDAGFPLAVSGTYLYFPSISAGALNFYRNGIDSSYSTTYVNKMDFNGKPVYSSNFCLSCTINNVKPSANIEEVYVTGNAYHAEINSKGNVHQPTVKGKIDAFLLRTTDPYMTSGQVHDSNNCRGDSIRFSISLSDDFHPLNTVDVYLSNTNGSFVNAQRIARVPVYKKGVSQFKVRIPLTIAGSADYRFMAITTRIPDTLIFQRTMTIHEGPEPEPYMPDGDYGCIGDTLSIEADESDIISYAWYKDSVKLSDTTSGINVTKSGHYRVVMISTNGCVAESRDLNFIFNPRPKSKFEPSGDTICLYKSSFKLRNKTTISDGSPIDYYWEFSDTTDDYNESPSKKFASPGRYLVRLTSTSLFWGCTDTLEREILFLEGPVAEFSSSADTCLEVNDFEFLNSSVPIDSNAYIWDFGTGTDFDTMQQGAFIYNSPGTYPIQLAVMHNNGCRDTARDTVTVFPTPKASFGFSADTVCLGEHLFTFKDQSTVSSGTISGIAWKIGDSVILNSKNIDHKFLDTGNFSVQLSVVTSKKCRDTFTKHVVVYPDPAVSYDIKGNNFCVGNITLACTDTFSFNTYQWFLDGAEISGATSPELVPTDSGSYNVKVTAFGFCSDTSAPASIDINPIPAKPIIIKNQQKLEVAGSYSSYLWYFNGKLVPGSNASEYPADRNGFYKVRVTNADGCENWSDSFEIKGLGIVNPGGGLHVYPNPFSDICIISSDGVQFSRLRLYDVSGKVLKQWNEAVYEVNLSEYKSGVYYLVVEDVYLNEFKIKLIKL